MSAEAKTLTQQDIDHKNWKICEALARREVVRCASMLVSHFAQHPESLEGSDYSYEDDVMPLLTQEDWKTPVEEHDGFVKEEDGYLCVTTDADDPDAATEFDMDDSDCWRDAAQELGIDEPYYNEALEHWIVSEWFAEKLAEKGEMTGELFDFHLWGRCCSGQAIYCDGVIMEIAKDMEILHGMQYEWSTT